MCKFSGLFYLVSFVFVASVPLFLLVAQPRLVLADCTTCFYLIRSSMIFGSVGIPILLKSFQTFSLHRILGRSGSLSAQGLFTKQLGKAVIRESIDIASQGLAFDFLLALHIRLTSVSASPKNYVTCDSSNESERYGSFSHNGFIEFSVHKQSIAV